MDNPKHKEELSDFLYRLYNSEIFDGCMPYDMKLVWSKTLNKTAGTCHMKRKGKYEGFQFISPTEIS
jgi:hypothetical protein